MAIAPEKKKEMQLIAARIGAFFQDALDKCCGKQGSCDNCCSGCASSNAHFDYLGVQVDGKYPYESKMHQVLRWQELSKITAAMVQLNALKDRYDWDPQFGFLASSGCKLPRVERSVYCQTTQCKYIAEHINPTNWNLLYEDVSKLKEIRKELGLLI